MANYLVSLRVFLVLLIITSTNNLVNDEGNYCISEYKCTQDILSVKCAMQNFCDTFYNFSLINPGHIERLILFCVNQHFQINNKSLSSLNEDPDSLMNNTFVQLKNLHELEIEDCEVKTIPPMSFNGVLQLTNLTIRSRNYRYGKTALQLSAETFSQLQLLEKLDLGENNINNLPQTLLCPLRQLETLNLTLNNFSDISSIGLSADSHDNVLCFVDVLRVHLSYNRIKVLTNKGFAAVTELKELWLDHNSISRAEDLALYGLDSLRVLDLSNNKIVALPPLVLRKCKELLELYMQNNSISVLPPGLFTGLQKLRTLDLRHNEITSRWLGSDTFADLIQVSTINASYNRLTQIDSTIFRSQYNLEVLHLDHNEIEVISDHAFTSLYKLHTLLLNNNRLTRITPTMFNGLYMLKMLSLSHNDISDVHPDAFHNNSAVMELNVANNKLIAVPTAVQSLQLLRSLDLSSNKISDIHNASYLGLENLYSLVLSGNNIGNLTKGVFEELPYLRILNLANNEIGYVETSTFDDVTYLHALRLDSNFLPEVNGLFNHLHDLMMLNISANRIEWFDYALVPIGLQWLDMHDNQIELLGNYFELEGVLKLHTLDASKNHITEIDSSSLPNGIEIIFLNNNNIKTIHPFTFIEKPNLTRVDLTHNCLENLEVNAFRLSEVRNRKTLPEFSISENPYLCDCNMEWMQRLGSLDEFWQYPRIADIEDISCKLTFNNIRKVAKVIRVHSSQFLCRYKSHCFALCHCCEFDACDCKMVCPENCTCFYDHSWNTNIVGCSSQNHISIPSRIPMDVTELYLDGNDIPSLSSHTFIGRKNMRILYMNNSNVHVINNRTFNGLKSLQTLYLQDNLIVALHGYEFERLVNLRHLYLSYNQIKAIGNLTFVHLKSLEILHLDHNYIVEFQVGNLGQNKKLVDIQLAHNPWACECQFVGEFIVWLQSQVDLIHDMNNINCVYNETFIFPLVQFNMTNCTNITVSSHGYIQSFYVNELMSVIILVVTTFVILILVCILTLSCHKRMRLWFFSKYGVRIFNADSKVSNKDDKLFDAFLSYSKKDEAFVGQVLAAELECRNPHYRLCLHYRDLPIGNYLSDTIIEAIESSHKTIVVLSENFIRSEWCCYEFKSVHLEVFRTYKNDLIMILISPLARRDLDPDLRLWLKTCTVLQWGDRKFWEKLRYALPDIQKRKTDRIHASAHPVSNHI